MAPATSNKKLRSTNASFLLTPTMRRRLLVEYPSKTGKFPRWATKAEKAEITGQQDIPAYYMKYLEKCEQKKIEWMKNPSPFSSYPVPMNLNEYREHRKLRGRIYIERKKLSTLLTAPFNKSYKKWQLCEPSIMSLIPDLDIGQLLLQPLQPYEFCITRRSSKKPEAIKTDFKS